jgi:hypothetical protein
VAQRGGPRAGMAVRPGALRGGVRGRMLLTCDRRGLRR